jgi:glutamyl-tRNA reductase
LQERLELASKGLQVHVVGLSIHHASVNVREGLSIPESEWNAASRELCSVGEVAEAAMLSTCNRFEVYYAAAEPREAMTHVNKYLAGRSVLPMSVLRKIFFLLVLSGDDAV